MIDIEITNETIKTNSKIYIIKNIKNIEFKKEKLDFITIFGTITMPMIIIVYFFPYILTISLLVGTLILYITKIIIYKTYLDDELIHKTLIENEFLELKNKIEKALISKNRENTNEDIKKNKFEENLKKQEKIYKQTYNENIQNEKPIIKKEPMTYAEKKEKGDEYETKVAGYYKLDGYEIYLNGIRNNRKDGGIDVICRKDNETLLIQCKNWDSNTGYKINHEKIKAFHSNCLKYIDENNLVKENTRLLYVVPDKKVFKNCAIEIFKDKYYNCRYEILAF